MPLPNGRFDSQRFREGTHDTLHHHLGAHPVVEQGVAGYRFAVWAPGAARVAVMGDFNQWSREAHPLQRDAESGVWSGFVGGALAGGRYRFLVEPGDGGPARERVDPFAFAWEPAPGNASVLCPVGETRRWRGGRVGKGPEEDRAGTISIYQVHLGSWRRVPEDGNRCLSFGELGEWLVRHAGALGFTHVELLGLLEHRRPVRNGMEVCGYFAPAARHGSPRELEGMLDRLHEAGLGVLLGWGLGSFREGLGELERYDGGWLFEAPPVDIDPGMEFPRRSFDLNRGEVRSFLWSSARFWLERFGMDGLHWVESGNGRGLSPILAGELRWSVLDALRLNFPGVLLMVDEGVDEDLDRGTDSGARPYWVVREFFTKVVGSVLLPETPVRSLAVMGWRSLYLGEDGDRRVLRFGGMSEGEGGEGWLARLPGDDWRRFAAYRLWMAGVALQPGAKMWFMGAEFGAWRGWNPEASLDWHLVEEGNRHDGVQRLTGTLRALLRSHPMMGGAAGALGGCGRLETAGLGKGVVGWWVRGGTADAEILVVVANADPEPIHNARIGVPRGGEWEEVLNTDAREYGGSGQGNLGGVESSPLGWAGETHSLTVVLPPLGLVVFRSGRGRGGGGDGAT